MWGTLLSEPLLIIALVGRYPPNQLIRRKPLPNHIAALSPHTRWQKGTMRVYPSFRRAIPQFGAGCLRVTHPFATMPLLTPFDLHVLGLPLAFILSQDQTLHRKYVCPARRRDVSFVNVPPEPKFSRDRSLTVLMYFADSWSKNERSAVADRGAIKAVSYRVLY